MPDFFKSIKITQPTPGGPLIEQVVGAVQMSTGTVADAGKLVVLNSSGTIDPSMVSGGGGGASTLLYPDDSTSPIAGYHLLTVDPETATEIHDVSPAMAVIGTEYLIDEPYVTLAGYPALTILPAGTWMFNIWAFTSDPTVAPVIDIKVYKISSPFTPGTEVLLFGGVSTPTITSTSVALYTVSFTATDFILAQTDQLVMHFYARATGGSNPAATVTFVHSGNLHASWISSPIPMVTSFSALSSGTNTEATMVVAGTASLAYSGTGVVNANEIGTINVAGNTPVHAGQLLISQPGNTTAVWADPQVQGLYDAGSTISPAPAFVAPTNIQPVLIGGSDGTTLRNILTDSSGHLLVNVNSIGTVTVTGTVAVSTVTSITNPVTVIQPTAANLNATVTGTVAVTQSTSPWVTTGNQSENSTTGSSFTGYIGTLPAQANTAAPTWVDGKLVPLSVDTSGALRVSTSGTFVPALTADRLATGSITSNQSVVVSTAGGGAVSIGVTGTWTGLLIFESSVDGANWVTNAVSPVPFGNLVTVTAGNGSWLIAVGGLNSFRVRGNTVATGTAVITLEVGAGANAITISDIIQGSVSVNNFPATQTVSGTVTSAQGSANTIANSWPVEVTDGTNVLGTVAHPLQTTFSNTSINANVHDGAGTSILSTSDSGTVGLNVHLTNTGGISGTQYVEGTSIGATGTGTLMIAKTSGNVAEGLHVDGSNNLNVNINTALPTGSNIIGQVEVTNGTNILFTTAHPGITQDVSDGATGAVVPSTALFAGGIGADGHLHGLSTDNSGVLNVNASVSGSFTPALTADRVNSSTINGASQSVSVSTQGAWTLIVNVTGTWSGTLQPQFLMPDGTSWVAGSVYPTLPGGTAVSSITANGQWTIPVGGINSFRLFSTAWTSGTATISEEAGAGGYSVAVHQGTAANLNATVNVSQVGGSNLTLGQKVSASSVPVVIASDQSSVNVVAQPSNNNIGFVGYSLPTASRLTSAAINFSTSGANTLIAGVGGQTIRVFRLMFNVGGSTTVTISDGSTTFSGPLTFTTSGGMVLDLSGDPWYVTGLSNPFKFTTSAAVQVGGTIWYTQS